MAGFKGRKAEAACSAQGAKGLQARTACAAKAGSPQEQGMHQGGSERQLSYFSLLAHAKRPR